jgi:hypothetical protein
MRIRSAACDKDFLLRVTDNPYGDVQVLHRILQMLPLKKRAQHAEPFD